MHRKNRATGLFRVFLSCLEINEGVDQVLNPYPINFRVSVASDAGFHLETG